MPELPEVETIKRGLAEVLLGKTIAEFEVRLPKIFQSEGPETLERLIGATVKSVQRRGKLLWITLSTEMSIVIHLKMTGQLIFREKGGIRLAGGHPTADIALNEYPTKVTHAIFRFTDGSELFFNDQRQFGYIKFLPTEDVPELGLMKTFGPEPLGPDFTVDWFRAGLKRRANSKLKPLLLDQTFIAGLGNIYVDEALNLARLHPLREAGSLSNAKADELHAAIIQVLKTSLKYGGTSDNTYVTIRGGKGDYLSYARVYHRTGLPCRRCGHVINRMVVAGRGTHYCPNCQRASRGLTLQVRPLVS